MSDFRQPGLQRSLLCSALCPSAASSASLLCRVSPSFATFSPWHGLCRASACGREKLRAEIVVGSASAEATACPSTNEFAQRRRSTARWTTLPCLPRSLHCLRRRPHQRAFLITLQGMHRQELFSAIPLSDQVAVAISSRSAAGWSTRTRKLACRRSTGSCAGQGKKHSIPSQAKSGTALDSSVVSARASTQIQIS